MGLDDRGPTYMENVQKFVPRSLPRFLANNREWGDYLAFGLSAGLVVIGGFGLYFPSLLRSNLELVSYLIIAAGVLYFVFVGTQARIYELFSRKRFSLDHFDDEYGGEKKLGMTEDGYVVYHSGSTADDIHVVEMGLFGEPKRVKGHTRRRIKSRLQNKRIKWAQLSEFGQNWHDAANAR